MTPLLEAPLVIQAHVAAVAVAIMLAIVQLSLPKGSPRHRLTGWVWVAAMVVICLSAFLILDRPIPPSLGPFSWLHLLAVFTLVMLWRAVKAARSGNIESHRKGMIYLSALGLGVPLIFAIVVPGRIVFRTLFGD